MFVEFGVPAGFGSGLHEPEALLVVDAELGVHDDAAVGLADGAHALRHFDGLILAERPLIHFVRGHGFDVRAVVAFIVHHAHGLAAHEAQNHVGAVVALEHVELVGRDHAAHDGFAEAVAGVDAHKVVAGGAAAAGGGVGGKGGAGHHGADHAHDAHRKRGVFNGPFLAGAFRNGGIAFLFGMRHGVENGLAAIGHGTQIVGRGAVPEIGFGHGVLAGDVQEGVLQAGESLLAGILARGGRTHGHGEFSLAGLVAHVAVGAAHGLVHFGGQSDGKNGGLHQHGAAAELVDVLLRFRKAVNHLIDEVAQTGAGALARAAFANFRGRPAHEGAEERVIGSHGGRSPVHLGHGRVHHFVHSEIARAALIEHHMEGRGGNGAELRRAYAFHAADERGVVVFAAHQHFGGFAHADDVRAGHNKTGTSFVHGIHAHKGLLSCFRGSAPLTFGMIAATLPDGKPQGGSDVRADG